MENSSQISRVGLVGTGLMGSGIAAVFAAAERTVFLFDKDPKRLDEAAKKIIEIHEEMRGANLTSASQTEVLSHVRPVSELAALSTAELIIEAVPEVLETKQALYRELERTVEREVIFASNTSGFMPSKLSETLAHPDRFIVAHFWNPPHAIPLVEVVPSPRTSPVVVEQTMALLRAARAEPVLVEKEIPGFIGNRLQYAILREALAIVRSGAASPESVDTVMKASLGRRYATVGPLETADLGGLDTFLTIASHLMPQLAKDEDVLELMRVRVEAGKTGLRSGEGFYPWPPQRAQEVIQRRNADLLRRRLSDLG
ncbi:MAG TPA: 3-hydroxyacyl-CoA dehydrogenase NAD-binding domain-containing protein [Chthoniobacterales bacterium]|nr:3-hydroxyacyl-CoA dehydrogenase NAD-binding domain-containing protein [Chthoniobacterales bacterium]